MEVWDIIIALQAVLFLLVTSTVIWVMARQRKHGFFERIGVRGPKPELLWGNWKQLKKNRLQVMAEWIKQYGKVFGIYLGDQPFMVITDTDIIKECFIKATKVFHDRPFYSINLEPMASSMPLLTGERWRNVRAVFNACFTVGKVKDFSGIVDSSVDRFLQMLHVACQGGISVDAFDASRALVLDVLTRTVLDWQVDCQPKRDDASLNALRTVFREADNALFDATFAYPGLRFILRCIFPFTAFCKAIGKIMSDARDKINQRRSGNVQRKNDVLQHVIDSQNGTGAVSAATIASARSIDDETLMSNLGTLLIAGFDTTSASLAFLLYLLAKHPEEQDKILAEIIPKLGGKLQNYETGKMENAYTRKVTEHKGSLKIVQNDNMHEAIHDRDFHGSDTTIEAGEVLDRTDRIKDVDHTKHLIQTKAENKLLISRPIDSVRNELNEDTVMNLERLDMFIREGLRLYPAIPVMIIRKCSEDITILGQFIPAGTTILSPPWHVHRDSEIWPEPERFLPDRFRAERREFLPSTYYPFGLGPKICVAHRLGMVVLKKSLYNVVKNYKLNIDEDVPEPLPLEVRNVVLNPAAPMNVRLQPRTMNVTE